MGEVWGPVRCRVAWLVPAFLLMLFAALPASSWALGDINLATDPSVTLTGPAGEEAGQEVRGLGDVNGDGKDDVLVGAWVADRNSRNESGSAYVVYGSPSIDDLDLGNLTQSQGFRIDGAAASDRLSF